MCLKPPPVSTIRGENFLIANLSAVNLVHSYSTGMQQPAICSLGSRLQAARLEQYLSNELLGHISRDSTANVGREN